MTLSIPHLTNGWCLCDNVVSDEGGSSQICRSLAEDVEIVMNKSSDFVPLLSSQVGIQFDVSHDLDKFFMIGRLYYNSL